MLVSDEVSDQSAPDRWVEETDRVPELCGTGAELLENISDRHVFARLDVVPGPLLGSHFTNRSRDRIGGYSGEMSDQISHRPIGTGGHGEPKGVLGKGVDQLGNPAGANEVGLGIVRHTQWNVYPSTNWRGSVTGIPPQMAKGRAMTDLIECFERSTDLFGERVAAVSPEQWSDNTPCTEWDVRALVNHLVYECLWMPPLLEGQTIADVGDRLDGDLLGDDPVGAYRNASAEALAAVNQEGALDRTVHLSFGDVPGSLYVMQLFTDLVVHSWDLSRGIGYDDSLPKDLMEVAFEGSKPYEQALRDSGLFAAPIEPGDDAPFQTVFLGFFGRQG